MDRYAADDLFAESPVEERESILAMLGGTPDCSVVVSARHGDAASRALRAAAGLMEAFPVSVLDDDNGGLHGPEEVRQRAESLSPEGIFAWHSAGGQREK